MVRCFACNKFTKPLNTQLRTVIENISAEAFSNLSCLCNKSINYVRRNWNEIKGGRGIKYQQRLIL